MNIYAYAKSLVNQLTPPFFFIGNTKNIIKYNQKKFHHGEELVLRDKDSLPFK